MDIRLFSVCIYLLATICTPVKSCGTKIPHGHIREGCQDFCRYWCDQGYEEVLEYPFVDCVVNRNNSWVPYKDEDEGVSEANLCRPKKCPEITVPNGNLQACVPTVGYSCSYSCKPGYSQKSSHISCLPTTEWSENPLVLCTSQNQCPYEIPKGALNFSCSRNPGDVCSFSCDLGMITDVPSRTLTCGETSTWNKALDSVCRVIKCPEEIPNGHIGSSCGRDFTDRCHFYCDTGFEKSPNLAFLTCNGSAQWEWHNQKEIPAVCLDKTRLCPALIENGKIYKYCSRSIGSKCGYSCDRYCSKNSHVPRLTCESDLTWQPQGRLCWDCKFT